MMENTLTEVLVGLSRSKKSLPSKFLYDEQGSRLFRRICDLEEYYPSRTENLIMRTCAREMARFIGSNAIIIEPGSGSGEKVRHLLSRLTRTRAYIPIEISGESLTMSIAEIGRLFPKLEVIPVQGDFLQEIQFPALLKTHPGKKVVFFPGSTIGNLDPDEVIGFLSRFSQVVGSGGGFLIGVDMKKDRDLLLRAYDDRQGITRDFNLNLLCRLNREAKASFDPQSFDHAVRWNEELGRIEMHLVSREEQTVQVSETMFRFQAGETIHTENAYKYSIEEFCEITGKAGLKLRKFWQDPDRFFGVFYLERE